MRIFMLLLLLPFVVFAQNEQKTIDSLQNIISNPAQTDTARINARAELGEVAGYLRIGYWDSIASDCEQFLITTTDTAYRSKYMKVQAQCYNNIGFISKRNGESVKALEFYLKSLALFEKLDNPRGLSTACNNLGLLYYSLGDIEKALEYYDRALKIRVETNDKHGMGNTYSNLGMLYQAQNDTVKSLEYYRLGLSVRESIRDDEGVSQSLNNIGTIFLDYGKYDSAMFYCRRSYALSKSVGDDKGTALALSNIANLTHLEGNPDSALYYNMQALVIREHIKLAQGIANTACKIAELYVEFNRMDSAMKYAKWSLDIAEQLNYAEQKMNAALILSQVYEKTGDGLKALEYYRMYIENRDKINSEQTRAATAKQQVTYEYEKQKAIDDAAHLKELEVEQQRQAKQKAIIVATLGGLILVIAFLIFIVNRLRITRNQKAIIEEQKLVVENAHEQLGQKNKEILDSINYAKRIQNAILPSAKSISESLPHSFVLYRPKDIVAGDFYWMEFRNNTLMFAVADCTGHGVPGALVSVICNNGLDRSVREFNLTDPGKILEKTREIVIGEFEKSEDEVKDGMDISLCSLNGKLLQWSGANNGMWIVRNSELIEFSPDKQPIGKHAENKPFTTHSFELKSGDHIYLYSDGYADQFGGDKGKKFKASRLKQLVASISTLPIDQQKEKLETTFSTWQGGLEQVDDVCIWGIRVS